MKKPTPEIRQNLEWGKDRWFVTPIGSIDDGDLDRILKAAQKDGSGDNGRDGAKGAARKISIYRKLLTDKTGDCPKQLEPLAVALAVLIGKTPHQWLVRGSRDDFPEVWYVEKIKYAPPDPRRGLAASTCLELVAAKRGKKIDHAIIFNNSDLRGKKQTLIELLEKEGWHLETRQIVADLAQYTVRYKEVCSLTGRQFHASGSASEIGDRYHHGAWTEMVRDGVPAKVVMDDEADESEDGDRDEGKSLLVETAFWKASGRVNVRSDDDDYSDDEEELQEDSEDDGAEDTTHVMPPLHPYVQVFDLSKHEFFHIHVGNLTEYQYDKTLIHKLVLPEEKKDLVGILIQGSNAILEDVVKGKTGGIIVIATGVPGTGKTLTAEVFAEEIEKPLYIVQCSQLGTNEEALEKQLSKVLTRASRWSAILLIDEADVYVRTRGDDIQQNAIVGVFLRVLEYYRGVLFLTSNRETEIDDAVMSRATAWIQYGKPDTKELELLWHVLAKQYKVGLTVNEAQMLVEEFHSITGRNIKNMLKLARLLAERRKAPVDVELLRSVAKFLPLDEDKVKPKASVL